MTNHEINYEELLKDPDLNRAPSVPPTVERPYLGKDKTYAAQRRQRLADVVDDYFQDEDITPREFYDDLIAEIRDLKEYHLHHLRRFEEVENLLRLGTPS
tara:strand:- start:6284 stop:6583 length:300 start_codon:yes stop_codon:yes gene_type:complete